MARRAGGFLALQHRVRDMVQASSLDLARVVGPD
jgi:hypothetical protein